MSLRGMGWALGLRDVSPVAKLCALRIGDLADPLQHFTSISRAALAEFACCDIADIIPALVELETEAGVKWDFKQPDRCLCRLPLPEEKLGGGPPVYSGPLTLYVISSGQATKIGISRDVNRRLDGLANSGGHMLTLEWVHVATAQLIRRAERLAHARLASHRVQGEWFSVTPAEAIAAAVAALSEAKAQLT